MHVHRMWPGKKRNVVKPCYLYTTIQSHFKKYSTTQHKAHLRLIVLFLLQEFVTKGNVDQELLEVHVATRPFKCNNCDKVSKNNVIFRIPLSSHYSIVIQYTNRMIL